MVEGAGRENRSAGEVEDVHGHMHNDVEEGHVGYADAAQADGDHCGPEANAVHCVIDPDPGSEPDIDVDNEFLQCHHLGLELVQAQDRHDHDDAGLEEVLFRSDLDPSSVLGHHHHRHYNPAHLLLKHLPQQ